MTCSDVAGSALLALDDELAELAGDNGSGAGSAGAGVGASIDDDAGDSAGFGRSRGTGTLGAAAIGAGRIRGNGTVGLAARTGAARTIANTTANNRITGERSRTRHGCLSYRNR